MIILLSNHHAKNWPLTKRFKATIHDHNKFIFILVVRVCPANFINYHPGVISEEA